MRMILIRIWRADFTLQRLICQEKNIQLNLNLIQLSQMRMILIRALRLSALLRRF